MIKSLSVVTLFLSLLVPTHTFAQVTPGTISKVTLSSSGGVQNGVAGSPRLAANGKYLVYNSNASNLVSGDTNRATDIFLRELATGNVSIISTDSNNVQGNANSTTPDISTVLPDGFYAVAFQSDATNLVTGISNSVIPNIYLKLPTLGKTLQVSFATGPVSASGASFTPSVAVIPNPNRVLVAFSSNATNLVSGIATPTRNIYIATIDTTALANPFSAVSITRIKPPVAVDPDNVSLLPRISGNGRYVVFQSFATNFVTDATAAFPPTTQQIYLYDIEKNKTTLVSKSAAGVPADRSCTDANISFNGRYISYLSSATNLGFSNQNAQFAVVRYDVTNNTTVRVDTKSDGTASNGSASGDSISANGRFVTFGSSATNLDATDTTTTLDIYVKDIEMNTLTRVITGVGGASPDGDSTNGFLSADGYNALSGAISFLSNAGNLVANDTAGTNVYLSPITIAPPPVTKKTSIEVPPDVIVNGKSVSFSLQKFDLPIVTPTPAPFSSAAAARRVVRYDVRIANTNGRRRDNKSKIAKRNEVSFRSLKPGTYTGSYRVMVMQGNKVRVRTKFSPKVRFTV